MSETLPEVLAAHVEVGGTYWDREKRTTYRRCACGQRCYSIARSNHADHLATAVLAWVEARLAGARESVAEAIGDEWLDGGHGVGCVHRDEPHDVTAARSTAAALVVVSRALGVEVDA